MGAGAGVGVGEWGGGSVYLSILGGTYCTQRSVESEHLFFFWRGSFFFAFFFLDRVGELAAEEKCFGSFYIFLFLEGAFLVLLLLLGSTWLFLFLSFFPGRASLEEGRWKREDGREEREERKAV